MQLKRRTVLVAGLYGAAAACRPTLVPHTEPQKGGGPRMQRLQDKVDSQDRQAALFIPSSYDGSAAVPLLLGTHGRGGNAGIVYRKYGWQDICEREGWLGVFPNYDPTNQTDSADNSYFDHLMKRVTGEHNVDAGRIWGSGFSGGCHRQYMLAVKHQWVRAIGVSGGAISHGDNPDRENPLTNHSRPISVLHIHGASDTSIPLGGGVLDGHDGARRGLLSVRDGIKPWIENIHGVPVDGASLPDGFPPRRGLRTHRWEGDNGHVVQIVVDPKLTHEWAFGYATTAIASWFKRLKIG